MQPKEAVALMGAHTLGQVDPRNSMFKYIWTRNEQAFFNNEYYHSLADDKQYVLQCKDCSMIADCKVCKKVSDKKPDWVLGAFIFYIKNSQYYLKKCLILAKQRKI